MTIVEKLPVPSTQIGESPVWNHRDHRLEWVDVTGKTLFRAEADGSDLQSLSCDDYPGFLALRPNGGRIVVFRRSFRLYDAHHAEEEELTISGFDATRERFNEGACDSRGRLWAGTLDKNVREPVGSLFRIDPDLTSLSVVRTFGTTRGVD